MTNSFTEQQIVSMKQACAQAVLQFIEEDAIIGVGSGSTITHFINVLAQHKHQIEGTVASSLQTEALLQAQSIRVFDLNVVDKVSIYVDSADEVNTHLQLIKGGGGALTREKILVGASQKFVCIADQRKQVSMLGSFPVAVEVISMARSFVAREIVKLGGDPIYRENFTTDNGHIILDVYNLKIMEPIKLEQQLNNIPGVVTNGIFAMKPADILLLGTNTGVEQKKTITSQVG